MTETLPLRGVPDGLRAEAKRQLRLDGDGREVEVRDRRGRLKLTRVHLSAVAPEATFRPSERELTFLLGAERRAWATVEQAFGAGAWARAVGFARGGAVAIECSLDGLAVGSPVCWRLTDPWIRRRRQRNTRRANERADWRERAAAGAELILDRYPMLAKALEGETGPVVRRVLVHAAEDLLAGQSYFGPRAFSQAHFGNTKARDDVHRILTRCEVELEAQIELGILRAGRVGLAGPIELRSTTGVLRFHGLRGPTDVRLDQPGQQLRCDASTLVVIENRQAAEAVSDTSPDLALLWTAGLMGPEGVAAAGELGGRAHRVIICPDADLGGVRIAAQVLDVCPHGEVLDIGEFPHEARSPFKRDGVSEIGLRATADGPAGALARACLERGYPVEQELAAAEALAAILSRPSTRATPRAGAQSDHARTSPRT
jgi:hypothetical protein